MKCSMTVSSWGEAFDARQHTLAEPQWSRA